MTVEQCYLDMRADYAGVLRRLGTEARVLRFLAMLPEDTSYAGLERALGAGDAAEAFRAAHSLKGISANLGLTALYESANALSEALRGGRLDAGAQALATQLRTDYGNTVECIRKLLGAG